MLIEGEVKEGHKRRLDVPGASQYHETSLCMARRGPYGTVTSNAILNFITVEIRSAMWRSQTDVRVLVLGEIVADPGRTALLPLRALSDVPGDVQFFRPALLR
jgi:hypothetical protein